MELIGHFKRDLQSWAIQEEFDKVLMVLMVMPRENFLSITKSLIQYDRNARLKVKNAGGDIKK